MTDIRKSLTEKAKAMGWRVSAAQAESRGEAILTDYLHTLVDPYGTVSSTLCTSRREGDGLLVTLPATA